MKKLPDGKYSELETEPDHFPRGGAGFGAAKTIYSKLELELEPVYFPGAGTMQNWPGFASVKRELPTEYFKLSTIWQNKVRDSQTTVHEDESGLICTREPRTLSNTGCIMAKPCDVVLQRHSEAREEAIRQRLQRATRRTILKQNPLYPWIMKRK